MWWSSKSWAGASLWQSTAATNGGKQNLDRRRIAMVVWGEYVAAFTAPAGNQWYVAEHRVDI